VRFITLIAKNVLHRPVRTVLTTVGLAVAISAVVILVGISWNFQQSFMAIYQTKGIDLVVVRAGSSTQLSSSLDSRMADRLRKIEGVAEVSPSLVDTVSFEDKNLVAVLVNGWMPASNLFRGVRIIEGRGIREGDQNVVMLGRVVAITLEKKAAEPLQIAGVPFQVIGIFESDSWFENGGIVMPLETLQKMMGKEGQVTGFLVHSASPDPKFINELRQRIEKTISGVAATPARDHVQSDTQIRLAKAMAWTTAAVALVLGSVGMLNTMLMSIFERTREIGILRAVGWRRRRVLQLVLGEALVIALMGTALGMLLAMAGLRAITSAPTARGFINPNLPPEVLLIALAMGIGLSLLGGLYPAVRAASLEPTEALRYE